MPTLLQVLKGESPANSAPVTIDFVPGTKFQYAGGNYTVIQFILIDVTGKALRFSGARPETLANSFVKTSRLMGSNRLRPQFRIFKSE